MRYPETLKKFAIILVLVFMMIGLSTLRIPMVSGIETILLILIGAQALSLRKWVQIDNYTYKIENQIDLEKSYLKRALLWHSVGNDTRSVVDLCNAMSHGEHNERLLAACGEILTKDSLPEFTFRSLLEKANPQMTDKELLDSIRQNALAYIEERKKFGVDPT